MMIGNATRNGRFVRGEILVVETGRDRAEFKYDAESTSVFPVDRRIESMRCRHDTNTGIFYFARESHSVEFMVSNKDLRTMIGNP